MWPAIVLTGIGAGLTGGLLMRLLRVVQHLSFNYRRGAYLSGVEGVPSAHRVLILCAAGILMGLALLLIRLIPDHDGPELNKAIWEHDGQLPEESMAVRALLSIIAVGMGMALGREAALKQGGGLAGLRFSEWFQLTPEQQKFLVACGTGAGMAAAYNVPLGGALFALEVLLGNFTLANALPAFATSFIATAVSWLLLPNEPTYLLPYLPITRSLIEWALLAGPLMGVAAIAFVRGIHWAKARKPKGAWVVLVPVAVFAVLGLASIPFPELLGNGKNVVQIALEDRLSVNLILWLVLLRPIAAMACLGSGAPGGLFTPTMTFGSLVGATLGQAWSYVSPDADKRAFALVGAGAVLAAATQAPISSIVFALELTYNANTLMVPLLIAVVGATWTYRHFEGRSSN